jgi:hypothetical protein
MVEYRDAAGRFDTDAPKSQDPLIRALGPVPDGGPLRTHYDQVVGIVGECRVDIILAQLEAHVPPLGERPTPAVAELAEHRLGWLDAQRRGLRHVVSAGRGLEPIAEGGARLRRNPGDEVGDARAEPAPAQAGYIQASQSRGHWRRPAAMGTAAQDPAVAGRAVTHAEAAAQVPHDPGTINARHSGAGRIVPIEHLRRVEQAIAVRSDRLGAELLTHPAPWMRADIAQRLEALDTDNVSLVPSRLAAGYGAVAVAADRVSLDPHGLSLERARQLVADQLGIDVGHPLHGPGLEGPGPPRPAMDLDQGSVGIGRGR